MTHKGWCAVKHQTNKQNLSWQFHFSRKNDPNEFVGTTQVRWLLP